PPRCLPPLPYTTLFRSGGDLGQLRDLPDDLDDVAVRVEDSELPVGAVAAAEDLLDPGELGLRAQLAGVRLEQLQRPADHLRNGEDRKSTRLNSSHGSIS